MSQFLRPEVIQNAINRLVESRAKSGFTDFLILKRALARSGSDSVPFSMNDDNFTGAINELAATVPSAAGFSAPVNVPGPFIKIFGTADAEKKYVSRKMLTNGPADTLSGRSWAKVVSVAGSHPRKGGLQKGYEGHLVDLLLKFGGKKPSLTDAAVWFYRATDLQSKLPASNGDGAKLLENLQASFANELGLTTREISELFDSTAAASAAKPADDFLQGDVPNPTTYLPDLNKPLPNVAAGSFSETAAAFLSAATTPEVGLRFSNRQSVNFVASLLSKHLVILTGLSGSGKTKLAQAFARWITPPSPECFAVVPVGADWTSNEYILGYPDNLNGGYVQQTALKLILQAEKYPEIPHFLILDEMNLSHVERYFADLLSLIESNEKVWLHHDDAAKRDGVPAQLVLPENLFIIGTVNVDETTYMFSPKVLDRANVLEFRVSEADMVEFLDHPVAPDLAKLAEPGTNGAAFGKEFVVAASQKHDAALSEEQRAQLKAELMLFFNALGEHNAEFGFRVGKEIARFLHFHEALSGGSLDFRAAMVAQIVQKLLP